MIEWLLKKIVVHLPHRTIETDGRRYMTRWYAAPRGPRTKDTGETASKWPFAIFLHHFYRGDEDREMHSHPWAWSVSLILTGGYREERENSIRVLRPGMINVLRADDFHRVDLLDAKRGCWTLFIAGRNVGSWGFKDRFSGRVVPWQQYVRRKHVTS